MKSYKKIAALNIFPTEVENNNRIGKTGIIKRKQDKDRSKK